MAGIQNVFIANRGEIALRIARTLRRLGLRALGAFSGADGGLPHLRLCQNAAELHGDPARVYLDIPGIVDAARRLKADAIHPGYGFLAENEDFAAAVEDAGMKFIGPTAAQIAKLGDKVEARKAAQAAGVPTVPGTREAVADAAAATAAANEIGFPILIKAAAGGGGRGMRVVQNAAGLDEALKRAQSEAQAAFGDSRVFIERYISRGRHVEIQIFGDGNGNAVWLGERECSVQRRHQKLIEESPAPALSPAAAARMGTLAAKLAASINYRGAGTMEFLVPYGTEEFYFMEVNTRLQVEHPVTELCTGLDLVEEQLEIAGSGGFSRRLKEIQKTGPVRRGHAIEARIIAEDPDAGFIPSCGKLEIVSFPAGPGIRVDAWAEAGLSVSPYYDSLLGKVLAWGNDRQEALARMELALRETLIHPVRTTAGFLAEIVSDKDFQAGEFDTQWLGRRAAKKAPSQSLLADAAILAAAERLSRGEISNHALREERPLSAWQRAEGPEVV